MSVYENLIAARALIDTAKKIKSTSVQDACAKINGDPTGGEEYLLILNEDDGERLTHEGILSYVDRAISKAKGE